MFEQLSFGMIALNCFAAAGGVACAALYLNRRKRIRRRKTLKSAFEGEPETFERLYGPGHSEPDDGEDFARQTMSDCADINRDLLELAGAAAEAEEQRLQAIERRLDAVEAALA